MPKTYNIKVQFSLIVELILTFDSSPKIAVFIVKRFFRVRRLNHLNNVVDSN